jgi:hypothetical protein
LMQQLDQLAGDRLAAFGVRGSVHGSVSWLGVHATVRRAG